MRILFKTSYLDDIRLLKHSGYSFWYGVLVVALVVAPALLAEFYVGELSPIFVLAIAGVGLMLLIGYTGLASLGHGAFMAIGAYTDTYLITKGVPFPIAFVTAGLLAMVAGIAVALPANRMTGIYLAIATLAFAVIMEQVFTHWTTVTGGARGFAVAKPELFGWELKTEAHFYYLCLVILILITLGTRNILRSATGRAMMAIRDSEISAQSMGIHIARTKVTSFGISTFITGIAGALLAHKIQFVSPEAFDLILSISLLLMIVVGGLGSLHGCFYGAIVVAFLPQFLSLVKDKLPGHIGNIPGLTGGVFGLILVLFILLEPYGIYGRWRKVRLFFEVFPLYRRATFKRQRGYLKTERMR